MKNEQGGEVAMKDKKSDDWWWKEEKEREDKSLPEDEQKTLIDEKAKQEKEEIWPPKEIAEERVLPLPKGILSQELHAHFKLINISGTFKRTRGLPHFFSVERDDTLIGIGKKAHIKLDDPNSVRVEHAKLIYKEKEKAFVIYPIGDAPVFVNGNRVSAKGLALKSEDRVKIGSADLIFFQVDLPKREKKTELPKEEQETLVETEES